MAETVTLTLTEFLLARIAEDEADAAGDDGSPVPIGMWAPERVLVECEAKRRIVESHPPAADEIGDLWCGTCTSPSLPYGDPWPCPTLRALALPYAVHPDCRDEWCP